MKLSEVKGERAFDVLEQLPDLLQPIVKDPESAALFSDRKKPKGMSNVEFGYRWLNGAITKLIIPHRKDFVKIMSLINDVTEAEYLENINVGKMTNDVMGLFTDEVFTTLFFSAGQKIETSSGSAMESIKGGEN